MIQVVNLLVDHPLVESLKRITLEYPLVTVWIKALLDVASTSPFCGHQLHLPESESSDKNDEGLLVVDQWSLGLTST